LAQKKDLWWKKWQPQNTRGSNERPSMEKEVTLKCKGLTRKTSDEKRGNPKIQGAQKKHLRWNKRQPQNPMGSNEWPSMKKEATIKRNGIKRKTSDEKSARASKETPSLEKGQPQNARG
jgi:hypothetical protein